MWFSVSVALAAEDSLQLHEQEIKAGLLYNFLKYTQWPEKEQTSNNNMVVCVYGNDPFEANLKPMSGRTVNQRAIAVASINNVHDIQNCNLLFVGAGEQKNWQEIERALKGKPVLTVSDMRGFIGAGGMIEFSRESSHISVNLSMDAMTKTGLNVHDRLLKLVTIIDAKER